MTVTRRIFDESKKYSFGIFQSLKELCHWDLNENVDELLNKEAEYLVAMFGDNCLLDDTGAGTPSVGGLSFEVSPVGASTDDFTYLPGVGVIQGRFVFAPTYGTLPTANISQALGTTNIVAKCAVETITEDVALTEYTIDFFGNKEMETMALELQDSVSGNQPRVLFTSGAESGNEFEIAFFTVGPDTTVKILGDASAVLAGDTFNILPPRLSANVAPQTDEIYVCQYYQEIDENVDADLEDPTLLITPTKRYASRVFVTCNHTFTQSTERLEGVVFLKIGEIERVAPSEVVFPVVDATLEYFKPTKALKAELTQLQLAQELPDRVISVNTPLLVTCPYAANDVSVEAISMTAARFGSVTNQVHEVEAYPTTAFDILDNDNYILSAASGSFLDETQLAATTTIPSISSNRDVVFIASLSDLATPGTQYMTTASLMSQDIIQRGFNYVVGDETGENFDLTILPGEAFRQKQWLCLPRSFTLDVTDTANWIEGALTTGDFAYIYMYVTPGFKHLKPFLSEHPPFADGSYHDLAELDSVLSSNYAFCIGYLLLIDATNVIPCRCINNTIHFPSFDGAVNPGIVARLNLIPSLATGTTASPAALPSATEYEVVIDGTEVGCTTVGYFTMWSSNNAIVKKIMAPSIGAPFTSTVTLGGEGGLIYITTNNPSGVPGDWTLTDVNVILTKITFNPTSFFNLQWG